MVDRVIDDPVYVRRFLEAASAPCRAAAFFRVCADCPAPRYPICEKDHDNVKGILSMCDVLTALAWCITNRGGLNNGLDSGN